uniref:Lipocalin/cytosolic fatty-acid binding domain-containing protein n=1 Tax=Strigops habroptila TaxID=2489341 RepID=A0A672UBP4_STRHB
MTAVLPCLALALLCVLQAAGEVPVQPGFNAEKFAGKWHFAATVSNCSVFLKMKDGMKSPTATISFTPEGDLAMKLAWPLPDRCQRLELLFQQSGQAGHYTAAQEKRDLRVMETDYSHYAIVHETQHSERQPSTALQLLMREQDVSPQLLQKFEELIPTVGLTKAMLAVLPKSGECWQGRGALTAPLHGDAQGNAHGVLTLLFAFQQISAPQPPGERGQGTRGVPPGMARAEWGLTASPGTPCLPQGSASHHLSLL